MVGPEAPPPTPAPLYAGSIHHAIAHGELARMKELVRACEEHLEEWGNIPIAFEMLKMEIARLEAKHNGT
jgi:hypothetical protein